MKSIIIPLLITGATVSNNLAVRQISAQAESTYQSYAFAISSLLVTNPLSVSTNGNYEIDPLASDTKEIATQASDSKEKVSPAAGTKEKVLRAEDTRETLPDLRDLKEKFPQATDRKEKVREALLPLLRGIFNTHWQNQEVLLTIDAGWRDDSLSIEYKYYRGTNVLTLNEDMLVEKIYFTVRPEEIDELDTENDEFLFLYLRNTGKKPNINQVVSRPQSREREVNWRSSLGLPVRAENLQMIIQYLKDLRTPD